MNASLSSLVTIVIPTYNVAHYLVSAIDSVLQQTYRDVEIIVVDDGSTDDTRARVEALGDSVSYVYQENQGIGAARNTGVAHARGGLLGFLDADDLFMPDKLERQVRHLSEHDSDLVFGHVEEFYSDELTDAERRGLLLRGGAHPAYMAQTMLVERSAFDRVGPFHRWRTGEFLDWYMRATDLGLKSQMLTEVVTRRRLHRSNMGIRARDSRTDFARIVKAAMDRRSAQARSESHS